MQKLDKIFAGLILVAMALFWVIMSPAAITSKISEAKPVSLEQPSASVSVDAPLTNAQKRARAEARRDAQNIARLKDRSGDTPDRKYEIPKKILSENAPTINPGDIQTDTVDDVPIFY